MSMASYFLLLWLQPHVKSTISLNRYIKSIWIKLLQILDFGNIFIPFENTNNFDLTRNNNKIFINSSKQNLADFYFLNIENPSIYKHTDIINLPTVSFVLPSLSSSHKKATVTLNELKRWNMQMLRCWLAIINYNYWVFRKLAFKQ